MLATVGYFGLSSSEKVYSTGYNNYSYTTMGMATSSTVTYRTPPKPRNWCWHCMDKLNVPALYNETWQQTIGSSYLWAVRGLQEAVERISEAGHFDWLLVSPLLGSYTT